MERLRYAVVPTHDRPVELAQCVAAIAAQVDHVIVIAHDCDYPHMFEHSRLTVIPYAAEVPNISTMWNLGLDHAALLASDQPYDVAVLNDDAIPASDWFTQVTAAMRTHGCVAGSGAARVTSNVHVWKSAEPVNLFHRMQGYAFILASEGGLRVDEQFRWWFGDDDVDWSARERAGTVVVGWAVVKHLHPSGSTNGELARIAGEDRERFRTKWGRTPH